FLDVLANTTFFADLGIFAEENQQRAKNEIAGALRPPATGQQQFAHDEPPKPWELHRRENFDRVWQALGTDQAQKSIYTGQDVRGRLAAKHASLDPDDMYATWASAARLFTKETRPNAQKLTDLTNHVVEKGPGKLVV